MKILTLDGGGIRGIIPCTFLAELERRLNRPAASMFDLMAGTSTGGIIAGGLNVPHPEQTGKPKFTAAEFGQLYEKNGPMIFKKRGGWFSGVNKLFDVSFSHDGLENLLRQYFGDTELRHTLTEVLITSYALEQRKPFYFLSRLARANPDTDNFLLRDIARSTSAAPTYFQPNALSWSQSDMLALVDGGVFANNPSMLAYTEAVELLRQRKMAAAAEPVAAGPADAGDLESFTATVTSEKTDIFILSLGTGRIVKPYRYQEAKSWGTTQWLRPIIDILMQGVSETVDYQMQYVLPPRPDGTKQYVRLNPLIPEENSEMSDVSERNIVALQGVARQAITDNDALIDEVCRILE